MFNTKTGDLIAYYWDRSFTVFSGVALAKRGHARYFFPCMASAVLVRSAAFSACGLGILRMDAPDALRSVLKASAEGCEKSGLPKQSAFYMKSVD